MKRNPKDRGYGYKKSYEYEDSIKESRQKLEDDFINFDDFMPMKKHMKKCQDIIIESIKKKKS